MKVDKCRFGWRWIAERQNNDSVLTLADCNPCGKLIERHIADLEAGEAVALKDASTHIPFSRVDSDHDGVVDSR